MQASSLLVTARKHAWILGHMYCLQAAAKDSWMAALMMWHGKCAPSLRRARRMLGANLDPHAPTHGCAQPAGVWWWQPHTRSHTRAHTPHAVLV